MFERGDDVTVTSFAGLEPAVVIEARGTEVVVRTAKGKRRAVPVSRVRAAERPTTKLRPLARPPVDAPYEASAPIAKDAGARVELYLKYVRAHPCACCRAPGPSEAHHWGPKGRSGGMGTKCSDFRTVPLCAICHEHFHRSGSLPNLERKDTENLFLCAQVDLLDAWASAEESRRG